MELRNISKSYHGRPVLQNVSFTIEPGVTALWAPSGAGKTPLLRILLGLERPDSGELLGTGVRWSAVFQEDRLLDGLDAMGNLRFALGSGWTRRPPGGCWRNWGFPMRRTGRCGNGPAA